MKKVYNSNGNYYKIYNNDCLIQMKKIKDKSIDLILCDLPYGTTAFKWDKVLDIKKLLKQYNRIIKDTGVIALFGSGQFLTILYSLPNFKYSWIWVKNNSTNFIHSKNRPMSKHEQILIYSKATVGHKSKLGNSRMPYNPQGLKKVDKIIISGNKTNGKDTLRNLLYKKGEKYIQEYTNYPNDVLFFDEDSGNKKNHPTQKPIKLLEYLIKTYSNENDLVLDNTMGSGSTGVACINLKRNFIGMELEKKYYKIAKKRLSENTISLF